jgi:hypothetical protein
MRTAGKVAQRHEARLKHAVAKMQADLENLTAILDQVSSES